MRVAELSTEIRTAVYAGLRLGEDLDRLERVAAVDAPEAAVFYAGRILEILIAEEVRLVAGEPSANVYGNLVRLSELGVMPELPARLAHTLRRVANEARHVQRPLNHDDVELARALLVHLLRWHFTRFARGPQLASMWENEEPEADPLARFVATLELEARAEAVQRLWETDARLARSAFTSALYIETLIADGSEKARAAAQACAATALARYPNDLRLRQLDGWLARLRGDLAGSAAKLEALLEESEDVETVGLLAGTYKRMGRLARAAELYRRVWKQSDRKSTYAGINAASVTLLAGQRDVALKIGAQVVEIFERRPPGAFTGYWDLVTYAEALLLMGRAGEAADAYRDAFARDAEQRGWIESTRSQLEQLLNALDAGTTVEAFLARRAG